jgi:hypothetical protein
MKTSKMKFVQPKVRNWLAVAAKFRTNAGAHKSSSEGRGGAKNLQVHWLDEAFEDSIVEVSE